MVSTTGMISMDLSSAGLCLLQYQLHKHNLPTSPTEARLMVGITNSSFNRIQVLPSIMNMIKSMMKKS